MSAFEGSYESLLQGVSQQVPRERLPGQVTAQDNMMSDPVTGPRRRPGAAYAFNATLTGATYSTIKAWYTDIAGASVHVVLNCADGTVLILDSDYSVLATLSGGSYLTATNTSDIRATTLADEFFLLNTTVLPTESGGSSGTAPTDRGYFYIAAGAFSKEYSVTIKTSTGTISASYTTPSGAGAGDAALSTPAYIAGQLQTTLNAAKATAGLSTVSIDTAYVYVEADGSTNNVVVNSTTGSTYLQVSKDGYTTVTGNLPASLPSEADGYIMRVGDTRVPQYYKYDHASTTWLESGDWVSPTSLTNMPVSITKVAGVWTLLTTAFEGRNAGDSESNPSPAFLSTGITGMGTYQGRLVLLAGSKVRMSASNKPRRMYRSTITSVLDSDPIEVGSSANSSAAYQYAVPFQKDLLLFSSQYQALIPSGNVAITPRTATVVLTSTHATDVTSEPVALGRTLMYPSPLSDSFFGLLEMIPSQFTDSQYVSNPATPHLPKYLGGRCRFSVSSSVANMVLFSPSGDPFSLVVHEYTWSADQKVQSAWHRWTFPYEVASAYFTNENIVLLFAQNDTLVGCTIDPRSGLLTDVAERVPYFDMYSMETITDNTVTPAAWRTAFDPSMLSNLSMARVSGALAGEPVGFSVVGSDLITVRSHDSGAATIGVAFTSLFSPTPPMVRDRNNVVISTNKLTILRYIVSTKNSGEYKVLVHDANNPDAAAVDVGTLLWSSLELLPGNPRTAAESASVVPCRTNAVSTVFAMYTAGPYEMNVLSLEYILKYKQKIRRR